MCIFKAMTGLPCPGCGMTRAFLRLFHGDLEGALYFHPLFWLVPVLAGLYLLSFRSEKARKLTQNNFFWGGCLVLLLAVYVWRMTELFPTTAPMDFEPHAPLGRLLSLFV